MAPAEVSSVVPALPQFPNKKPDTSPPETNAAGAREAGAPAAKDAGDTPGYTVDLSFVSRQTTSDAKKEEARLEEARKEKAQKQEALLAKSGEKPDRSFASIQFVYDQNGELSVRYMDSADRLIYQVPSELMLKLKEAASKSDAPVDTKA